MRQPQGPSSNTLADPLLPAGARHPLPALSLGAELLETPPSSPSHLLYPGPLTPNGQGLDLSYEILDSFSEQWAGL